MYIVPIYHIKKEHAKILKFAHLSADYCVLFEELDHSYLK